MVFKLFSLLTFNFKMVRNFFSNLPTSGPNWLSSFKLSCANGAAFASSRPVLLISVYHWFSCLSSFPECFLHHPCPTHLCQSDLTLLLNLCSPQLHLDSCPSCWLSRLKVLSSFILLFHLYLLSSFRGRVKALGLLRYPI